MDLSNLDPESAYDILIAINQLRRRLRDQENARYTYELRQYAMRHGIDESLLRAMVELTTTPIPLPVRES
jgi:hypothetical protein